MFAPALTRKVNVAVSGNASGYNAAMAGATANTAKFTKGVTAAMAAVVALSGVMAGMSVKSAAGFEEAMARVKAISGATGGALHSLQNEAKRLGKISKYTMVQIAGGMENLARAGLKPNQIIKTMAGVTALASASGIELSESAKMVTRAMKGMGLAVTDVNRIANVYAKTAASANLNVMELSEAFTIFAPLGRTLKMSLEDISGMIGALADVGLVGTKATTVLATAMARLAKPPAATARMMKTLNIEMWNAQGQFVGMVPLVAQLEDRFKGLTDQQKAGAVAAIFGQRAFKNWMSLINSGSENLAELIAEVTGTNAAFEQQRIMLDNVAGGWVILTSSIDAMWQAMGEPALGTIQKGLAWLTSLVNSLIDRIRAAGPYIKAFFETMYLYVKQNREAFGYLIKMVLNFGKVIGVIGLVAAAFKLLLSPIAWMTVAAVGLYAAWKVNLYGIRDIIVDLKDRFLEWFATIDLAATWENIKTKFTEFKGWIDDVVESVRSGVGVLGTLGDILGTIGDMAARIVSVPIQFGLDLAGQDDMAASVGAFFSTLPGKLLAVAGIGILGKALLGGLFSAGVLTGSVLTLPAIAIVAHIGWSVFSFIKELGTGGGVGAAIGSAVPMAGGILGAILGTIIGGPGWGTVIGYALGAATGAGIRVAVDAVMDLNWSILSTVGEVSGNGPGVRPGTGWDPSRWFEMGYDWFTGRKAGGLIPGTGLGDIVPAMLEPGEFVIPKWMMQIREVKNLITGIWSNGPKMAAGGPVGLTAGGAGGVAVSSVFSKMESVLDAMYNWLLPRAEDVSTLDEMFDTIRTLVATGADLSGGFQVALAAALAEVDATYATIEELNAQADAVAEFNENLIEAAEAAAEASRIFDEVTNKVRGYLTQIPGLLGELAGSLIDAIQAIKANDWGGIANAIGQMFLSVLRNQLKKLQEKLAALNEELAELQKIESFYLGAMETIGNVVSSVAGSIGALGPIGSILSTTLRLVTDSFAMLKLTGIDLLNAGLSALSTLVTSMVGIFSDLIQRSDAYAAVQKESESIWETVGNMLGEFLWPLVAAIRYLKEWLGIQDDVNDRLSEVGVPAMFKRTRRAFEAAAPGQIVTGEGPEIPPWAVALGKSLGAVIKKILEGFGIDSIAGVIDKIRAWAVTAWNWAIGALPGFVSDLKAFLGNIWDVLKSTYSWAVDLWNEVGGWSGILAKWDEFKATLGTLPTWTEIQSEITRVLAAIAGVEAAIRGVEAAIKLFTVIFAIIATVLAILQVLGLISGFGAATVAAVGTAIAGIAAVAGGIVLTIAAVAAVALAVALVAAAVILLGPMIVDAAVAIVTVLGSVITAVVSAAASVAIAVVTAMGSIIASVVTAIGGVIAAIITAIGGFAAAVVTAVGSVIGGMLSAIGSIIGGILSAIGGIASVIAATIGGLSGLFVSALNAIAVAMRNQVVRVNVNVNCSGGGSGSGTGTGGSGTGGGGLLGNIWRGITNAWNWFWNAIGFAKGGFVTKPTLGLVGEGKHSEGVFPLSADTFKRFSVGIVDAMNSITGGVGLSPSLASAGAGGQAINVTVYNEIAVYLGEDEVTDLVIDGVQSKSRSVSGSRSSASAITRRR